MAEDKVSRKNPRLRDHFLRPRNVGRLERLSGSATVENPACGDVLTLDLLKNPSVLLDLRFQAQACSAAIAVASILTETLRGATLEAAHRFGRKELLEAVGPIPRGKQHAITLALEALRGALKDAESQSRGRPSDSPEGSER